MCISYLGFENACCGACFVVVGDSPDAKGEDFVYPFLWVAVVFIFAWDWLTSGKTIGAKMFLSWDMDEFEVEKLDGGDPPVHCCVGLDVWVV